MSTRISEGLPPYQPTPRARTGARQELSATKETLKNEPESSFTEDSFHSGEGRQEESIQKESVKEESIGHSHTSHRNPFHCLGAPFRALARAVRHSNRTVHPAPETGSGEPEVLRLPLQSPDRLIHHTLKRNNWRAKRLIRSGKVDLDRVGIGGMSPLEHAVRMDNQTVARALIKAGVDPNPTDPFGKTPIQVATSSGSDAMLAILLEANGVDLEKKGSMGRTAVHLACERNSPIFLSRLLTAGASVKKVDTFGSVPLHIAAENRYPEHIQLLLGAGADINAPDAFGHTPLDRAATFISKRHIPDRAAETIALLLQHGAKPGQTMHMQDFKISHVPDPRTIESLSILLEKARKYGNQPLVDLLEQHLELSEPSVSGDS